MTAREVSHWLLTVMLFISTVTLFVRINQIEKLHRSSEMESVEVFNKMSEYTYEQTGYIKALHVRIGKLEKILGIE